MTLRLNSLLRDLLVTLACVLHISLLCFVIVAYRRSPSIRSTLNDLLVYGGLVSTSLMSILVLTGSLLAAVSVLHQTNIWCGVMNYLLRSVDVSGVVVLLSVLAWRLHMLRRGAVLSKRAAIGVGSLAVTVGVMDGILHVATVDIGTPPWCVPSNVHAAVGVNGSLLALIMGVAFATAFLICKSPLLSSEEKKSAFRCYVILSLYVNTALLQNIFLLIGGTAFDSWMALISILTPLAGTFLNLWVAIPERLLPIHTPRVAFSELWAQLPQRHADHASQVEMSINLNECSD